MEFEWDEDKARTNFNKHKVSFNEAATVFSDPFLLTYPDEEHSDKEQRFIDIGSSSSGRVLIVIHVERQGVIRIISCRNATKIERKTYEEENF